MSVAVLVVEDEPFIRMMAMDYVESFVTAGKLFAGHGPTILADGLQEFSATARQLGNPKNPGVLTLGAGDYREAQAMLADCRHRKIPLGLVVTDGQFPGGSGPRLVKEEISQDTPWIGVTGNVNKWAEDASSCGLVHPQERVLGKPYTESVLFHAIERAMHLVA